MVTTTCISLWQITQTCVTSIQWWIRWKVLRKKSKPSIYIHIKPFQRVHTHTHVMGMQAHYSGHIVKEKFDSKFYATFEFCKKHHNHFKYIHYFTKLSILCWQNQSQKKSTYSRIRCKWCASGWYWTIKFLNFV